MTDARETDQDLGYVRRVVQRSEAGSDPAAIWYLWAVIGALGFALIDFAPDRVPLYWMIMGPAGFVASVWLGWRHSRAIGQESDREGRAHLLHWGATLIAAFLLVPLVADLPSDGLARALLILLALAYFLAGVHLVPPLRWLGLAMALASLAVPYLTPYAWTSVGALVAIGLVATARSTARDGGGS